MPNMTDETTMRRRPKQVRGQQRVDLLLEAAAAEFAQSGYENATTNAIAARAGVSIGSLYQFFPNKEAMLNALTERYRAEMQAVFEEYFTPDNTDGIPFPDVIGGLIDGLLRFKSSHPGFDTTFNAPSLENASAMTDIHQDMVGWVDAMLAARFPALDGGNRLRSAAVGVSIVKGVMTLTEPPNNLPLEQVIPEMKAAVVGYVREMLLREGHPLPEDLQIKAD